MSEKPENVKTLRGEQTRAVILETALELFRERGYEETTMRAIAERAGVALGNAYYYFRSKEHLIQAFYGRTHDEHLAACVSILERERTLKGRLLGVINAKLDVIEPYHQFSGILFKTAADPASPLNPFGPESLQVREQSTALFTEVLKGAKTKVPDDLMVELPELLWVFHMGIILFWIHDKSRNRIRSYRLAEHTTDLVTKLIRLASLPVMRPVRKSLLRMLESLKTDTAE